MESFSEHGVEDALVERALGGDEAALADAFARYRSRLKRMVSLRLDPRLRRRVDASDIVQEAYVELSAQLPQYLEKQDLPFFLWLRLVTRHRLAKAHRRHLGVAKRDVAAEVHVQSGAAAVSSGYELMSQLVSEGSSPSQTAMREETEAVVREALSSLDAPDREILTLRHIEELSNREAALELGLKESTASMRHLRALTKLRDALDEVPGMFSGP